MSLIFDAYHKRWAPAWTFFHLIFPNCQQLWKMTHRGEKARRHVVEKSEGFHTPFRMPKGGWKGGTAGRALGWHTADPGSIFCSTNGPESFLPVVSLLGSEARVDAKYCRMCPWPPKGRAEEPLGTRLASLLLALAFVFVFIEARKMIFNQMFLRIKNSGCTCHTQNFAFQTSHSLTLSLPAQRMDQISFVLLIALWKPLDHR